MEPWPWLPWLQEEQPAQQQAQQPAATAAAGRVRVKITLWLDEPVEQQLQQQLQREQQRLAQQREELQQRREQQEQREQQLQQLQGFTSKERAFQASGRIAFDTIGIAFGTIGIAFGTSCCIAVGIAFGTFGCIAFGTIGCIRGRRGGGPIGSTRQLDICTRQRSKGRGGAGARPVRTFGCIAFGTIGIAFGTIGIAFGTSCCIAVGIAFGTFGCIAFGTIGCIRGRRGGGPIGSTRQLDICTRQRSKGRGGAGARPAAARQLDMMGGDDATWLPRRYRNLGPTSGSRKLLERDELGRASGRAGGRGFHTTVCSAQAADHRRLDGEACRQPTSSDAATAAK